MFAPRGNPSKIIALIASVASLSNFLEGYSSSYPNTAGDSFREFINNSYIERGTGPLSSWEFTWFWSFLLNIWFLGYLAGTLCTPIVTETYGRKNSLCLANAVSLLGTAVSALGLLLHLPELLLCGRSIAAVGSGLSFGALILFIQETTPTAYRGTCSFLSEVSYLAVNVIGMGMGMDLLLGHNLLALVGIGAVPGVLSVLVVLPLKESPKFLLINQNDRTKALEALDFYHGIQLDNHSAFISEVMKEMVENRRGGGDGGANLSLWGAMVEVVREPHLRKAVAIGTLALQTIVGIWPIIYISTDLLETHFDVESSQYSSLAFICANFFASIIGACTVEKFDAFFCRFLCLKNILCHFWFGRRPMLIFCAVANTLCLCSILYTNNHFKYGCVASLVAYGITYGVALGPIAFFITSELVPQRFRSLVQSVVFCINTVINFIFSFITLPLYELIDVWSFIPLFIIPSVVSIWYLVRELPETKGREIHEIVEQLKKGSRRRSSSEVTTPHSKTSWPPSNPPTTTEKSWSEIPDILLPSCGHSKNSLIKSAVGGASIAATIIRVVAHAQRTGAAATGESLEGLEERERRANIDPLAPKKEIL
uniref:Major facilitator superfamily (MFS) profile domain-containing protein n=1 Tax=Globodera rostochiensis TaxID=31243 RepID=A0A914HPN9_GLORO